MKSSKLIQMKSIVLTKEGGPEVFSLEESPKPTPLEEEVIVKVYGTAATITELQWWPTWNTMEGSPRINPIPSHEFSGVIESVGSNVNGFKVGDHVYGLNGWFNNGALAEYVSVQTSEIYFKPDKLSHIEAGVTPLSALTAYQGIVSNRKVKNGETVLILGASGAVGGFAVQLAHHFGADVIAVASKANEDYLKSLGANTVVDYRLEKFENYSDNVDLILDLVGGESLERSVKIIGTSSWYLMLQP